MIRRRQTYSSPQKFRQLFSINLTSTVVLGQWLLLQTPQSVKPSAKESNRRNFELLFFPMICILRVKKRQIIVITQWMILWKWLGSHQIQMLCLKSFINLSCNLKSCNGAGLFRWILVYWLAMQVFTNLFTSSRMPGLTNRCEISLCEVVKIKWVIIWTCQV